MLDGRRYYVDGVVRSADNDLQNVVNEGMSTDFVHFCSNDVDLGLETGVQRWDTVYQSLFDQEMSNRWLTTADDRF